MENMFEEEIVLVRNSKAAQIKGWVAIVRLDEGDIEFLSPIEAEYSKNKLLVSGIYRFTNGDLYIVAVDSSSHKNSRQSYILYLAQDSKLNEIARIHFDRAREFYGCDDDVKQKLRNIYSKQKEGRKVINTLIKVAQYFAQRSM